ncbi:MAG TPA: hypothetical protein VKB58_04405 [Terriglobales bacterium]|nr:hypothetical protein [Terriglobales bacterium]
MKRFTVGLFSLLLLAGTLAQAQYQAYPEGPQVDATFGVGTLLAPSSSFNANPVNHSPQSLSGGTYLSFSGDALFWRHLGAQGEVAWRAGQGLYLGVQPYRPILYDFNVIYAPPLGRHAQLEMLAGIGGLSTRFYTPVYFCNFYGCANYYSSNHFLGDVGFAVRFYVGRGVFIRPEFREYFINNNVEYGSPYATRLGRLHRIFLWALKFFASCLYENGHH